MANYLESIYGSGRSVEVVGVGGFTVLTDGTRSEGKRPTVADSYRNITSGSRRLTRF